MAINCFRYLNFQNFSEVDRLTIPQCEILLEVIRLKQVDQDYRNHQQAFLDFAVRAKKKTGKYKEKPVYSTFKKFYDYEKEIKKARKIDSKERQPSVLSKFLKKGG